MIKAGIFDVGGVLISYSDTYVMDDIKKTLGIDPDTFKKAWDNLIPIFQLGEINEKEFWEKFLSETHTAKSLPEEDLLVRGMREKYFIHEKMLKLIHLLKDNGYKLAVLSNIIKPHFVFLEKQGIYKNFDVKVFSDQVHLQKPDPRIYLLTLERLGVDPKESFFIDNKKEYIEAANNLGIHGILFEDDAEKFEEKLRALGVKI